MKSAVRSARCIALLSLALSGCFAELNGGYYPATKIETLATATNARVSQTDAALMFGFNMGVYLDLFGVGASYGFFGEDTVRGASGLPNHYGGQGRWLRLDGDLPVRFAKGWVGLRATYAYESYGTAKLGPNVDRRNDTVGGDGSAHFGGVSFSVPGNDFSVALGLRTFSMNAAPSTFWPGFQTSGTGPAMRVMIRWIPTGAMWANYKPEASRPQAAGACPHPNTKTVCGYGPGGNRCSEQFTCD